MLDLILRGGNVLDGTGASPYRADVGVRDGRIASIGPLHDDTSRETIQVDGRIVCPGFVDTHAHSELAYFNDPEMGPKIHQGVTTEIVGQDGLSVVPIDPDHASEMRRHVAGLVGDFAVEWNWRTVDDYLNQISELRPATNAATLAAHGMIRAQVLGFENRPPDRRELDVMKAGLAAALDAGAVGMSTGLIYAPCAYADIHELIALCKVVAQAGALFVIHMRSESGNIIGAIDEALRVARDTGVRLNISHLKVLGLANTDRLPAVLDRIDTAHDEGIDISFDQYPYFAGGSMLSILLPPWTHEGGSQALLYRLADPRIRRQLRAELNAPAEWENFVFNCGWDSIVVTGVTTEANKFMEGRTLAEIAASQKKDTVDCLADLLIAEDGAVSMIVFWGEESSVEEIMAHPLQMVGTDGIFAAHPHPRLYGTFPRVLGRYVREKRLIPLPEAVRRMTSTPAARHGLHDRGVVREGMVADLVVFDPDAIADRATYERPRELPVGIEYVIVGGAVTIRHGRVTDAFGGSGLRRVGTPR